MVKIIKNWNKSNKCQGYSTRNDYKTLNIKK